MEVIVAGDIEKPILFRSSKATAVMIDTDDGNPTVIFRMLPGGIGWSRLTKGEDKNFNQVARSLGLMK
jgi:hypothetical protein